jgi:hypothetical protein
MAVAASAMMTVIHTIFKNIKYIRPPVMFSDLIPIFLMVLVSGNCHYNKNQLLFCPSVKYSRFRKTHLNGVHFCSLKTCRGYGNRPYKGPCIGFVAHHTKKLIK